MVIEILAGSVARGCAAGWIGNGDSSRFRRAGLRGGGGGVGENSAPGLRAERRVYGFPSRELSRDVGCL